MTRFKIRYYFGSLKAMLLVSVTLLVFLTGASVSQFVIGSYSASLRDGAIATAENIAHSLALDVTDKLLINDLVSVQKLFDAQMQSNPSIAYLFVLNNGNVPVHTFSNGIPINLVKLNRTGGNTPGIVKFISQDKNRYIDISWPVFEGRSGMLRMGYSEASYREKVAGLKLKMTLMTLMILLVTLALSYAMILIFFRPLATLTEVVQNMDMDNLDARVDVKGRAEVTRLARAYNEMLDRIKTHTGRLTEYTHRLEKNHKALDRAHNQLLTIFSISEAVNKLPDLKRICVFLVQTISSLMECRDIIMVVFDHEKKQVLMATGKEVVELQKNMYGKLSQQIDTVDRTIFFKDHEIGELDLDEYFKGAREMAVFPFHHQTRVLGAIVVACPDRCVKTETKVVHQILGQVSGSIFRAFDHEKRIRDLQKRVEPVCGFGEMVGKDAKIQVIYKLIEDAGPTDATVLILGESGTGKEMVAKAIHGVSGRSDRPFIVINCSAYPATLLESELFGHEKGAFTGAIGRKTGRFEQADGGTVFLDEVGEISASAQTMLLRVLQSQKIERIGGRRSIRVNIRVLAATNRDLMQDVKMGRFREDLYYRLNVIPINLPPLRDRRNDIPLLADHFLRRFADEQGKSMVSIDIDAMRMLMDYHWPGNIRELENSIEHAVTLSKSEKIFLSDFPSALMENVAVQDTSNENPLLEAEEKTIRQALETCKWNKTAAASYLKISRSTLYEKLKKFRITPPE